METLLTLVVTAFLLFAGYALLCDGLPRFVGWVVRGLVKWQVEGRITSRAPTPSDH